TLESQDTEVQPGDILLVRTGWLKWYRSLNAEHRAALARDGALASCGLQPGTDTVRALWDMHIAAIAADNPALELWPPGSLMEPDDVEKIRTDPGRVHELFAHFSILPLLGLPIGELFDLDGLSLDCMEDGVYTCRSEEHTSELQH